MLHAGLDLSRRKLDLCLLSDEGRHLDQLAVPPDVDSLRTLARRIDEVHGEPVAAVVESMTGARLVHDTLEACGWDVEIADAQVKGLDRAAAVAPWIDPSTITSPALGPCTQIRPGVRGATDSSPATALHNHSPPSLTAAPGSDNEVSLGGGWRFWRLSRASICSATAEACIRVRASVSTAERTRSLGRFRSLSTWVAQVPASMISSTAFL